MTALVFVDTNVFLYAREPAETARQPRAAQWIAYLWRERLGRTSMQVLCEFYVNVTRKLAARVAPEDLQDRALFGGVTVRSPFTLEVREPVAAYAAVPPARSRHQPRGRPRR